MTDSRHALFHTMILRAWSESDRSADDPTWRFRLQNVRTGERLTFSTTHELLRYLAKTFNPNATDDTPVEPSEHER